jgi:hypothetical protein
VPANPVVEHLDSRNVGDSSLRVRHLRVLSS